MASLISIIVLTYGRDEVLEPTFSRLHEFVKPDQNYEVILVDNNADNVDRSAYLARFPLARLIKAEKNLGVTGGRNLGIKDAKGELLFFLDDDALLEGPRDLLDQIRYQFAESTLGALAFNSVVGKDRLDDPKEFPHTDKSLDRTLRFETFRFIGVAHVLRASAVREVGFYNENFFYGMEEFDMSFRLMKLSYKIVYDPKFRVQHMRNSHGRLPSPAVIQRMFVNKLAVVWNHLPVWNAVVISTLWFLKTALDARSLIVPINALDSFTDAFLAGKFGTRRPSKRVIQEIVRLGGNPWR